MLLIVKLAKKIHPLKNHVQKYAPQYVYALLALIIIGPLLKIGYVMTLDMAWVPNLKLTPLSNNTFPLYVVMVALAKITSSMFVQKLILLLIIWLSGYGMHCLARAALQAKKSQERSVTIAAYFAGLLYAVNPFVYERFMDGHWLVLLGFAFLPWFVLAAAKFVHSPNIKNGAKFIAWTLAITFSSMHTIFMALLLFLTVLGVQFWRVRKQSSSVKKLLAGTAAFLVIVGVLNLFWAIPLVTHDSTQAVTISTFDEQHAMSFRTIGDGWMPAGLNVLTLHGYWGENQDRFMITKDAVAIWPLLIIAILLLVGLGFYRLWRTSRQVAIAAFILLVVTWIFALGSSAPVVGSINQWLTTHIPFFAGYREPQKFVALIVLIYALVGSFGAYAIVSRFNKNDAWTKRTIAIILLCLPLLYTPLMLWGFYGQLKSTDYPNDWYVVNESMRSDTQGSVLFLPWHQYLYLNFVGRTAPNPASRFFDMPVVQSANPEIGLLPDKNMTPTQKSIDTLLETKNPDTVAETLSGLDIQYIFVAKTADWQDYTFLGTAKDLRIVKESDTVILYRNEGLK